MSFPDYQRGFYTPYPSNTITSGGTGGYSYPVYGSPIYYDTSVTTVTFQNEVNSLYKTQNY